MLVLHPYTPDEGLWLALDYLKDLAVITESRNGPVARFRQPVTTVWSEPINRIQWSPLRDANPLFSYLESIWMLAGQNDVATVAKLAAQMATYSDDGKTLWGAYGYRWRQHFECDQIALIIDELKANPTTRRCVLQMWDGYKDLEFATSGGKDAPCNSAIYFDPLDGVLNMTVSNRSNDIVWGAYGANIVHMSILHEYVASMVGMRVGTYYQMSNNLHLYLDLSPVMSRLARLDEFQNLVVTPCDVDLNLSLSKQEPLFDDLKSTFYDDQKFLSKSKLILESFLKGEPMQYWGQNLPKSLELATIFSNAFNIYKQQSAKDAVIYLNSTTSRTQFWIQNAVEWLKRRPSYEE